MVGDANGGDLGWSQTCLGEDLRGDAGLAGPDLVGIVFDPTGPGKYLAKLLLGDRLDATGVVENDRTRTGRALVQR